MGWAGKVCGCPGCGAINAAGMLGCLTCQVAFVFKEPQTGSLFSPIAKELATRPRSRQTWQRRPR
eukprot:4140571-Lingulodinium_polyedra.AAC.1